MDKILPLLTSTVLVIDSQHSKYQAGKPLHEAGYDSLLAAQVLIRLSAKIRDKEMHLKDITRSIWVNRNSNSTPMANPRMTIRPLSQTTQCEIDKKVDSVVDIDEPSAGSLNDAAPETLRAGAAGIEQSTKQKRLCQSPKQWQEPTEITRLQSIFAHPTKFDLLTDQTEEVITLPQVEITEYRSPSLGEAPPSTFREEILEREENLIPPFDTDFWKAYWNKLRVFGTLEGVCDLLITAILRVKIETTRT